MVAQESLTSRIGLASLVGACRGPEQIKQVLISDSDSAGASDSASAASDFCASEESQQSESDASSMDDDDEDSPPPAKKGKKVVSHVSCFVATEPSQIPGALSPYS